MENTAIEVSHLSKTYKLYERNSDRLREALHLTRRPRHTEHHALDDVSLSIRTGETVGIIGTNGSGKSTILKIITGVLQPTGGSVRVNGRISALLELGAGFNPEYTGIENVYLNGAMIGFTEKEIDERLDSILSFADIGDFAYQPVRTYSSGMFVRLAFAVAINIEPEILIVDEALSVGDVFFQSKCYHKFEEFKEMGKTILFVSHDLSSIAKYCDRVVVLDRGHKVSEGAPKEMIDIYKQILVGQYDYEDPENNSNNQAAAETGDTTAKDQSSHASQEDQADLSAADDKKAADKNSTRPAKAGSSVKTSSGNDIDENALEYGSGKARITAVRICDDQNREASAILKGSKCTVTMNVEILEDLPSPIFAMSVKDVRGTEITGTNTMFEKAFLDSCKKGDKKEITFTQAIDLQGGEYLLSFGVTGYEGDSFTVYHRLYDALHITVVSEKNTVGFYDMNSVVTVRDA